MQSINTILKIAAGSGQWCSDTLGSNNPDSPIIRLAMSAKLIIDLRSDQADLDTGVLVPFPYEEVAACASFYVAIDSDWNQLTIPPIKKFSGITVTQNAAAETILGVELPDLDSPELRNAVKTNEFVNLKGEVGGLDANGKSIFLVDFTIRLKNRVWIPDGSSGDTPDPADPDYLTTPQVRAYIETELAAAVAAMELPTGEPGPAPTITIGTVQTGVSAAASITPVVGTPGAYTLNLTLPRATDGSTPEPIAPVISIGTVQTGDEAAVSITPVVGTPGAYTINLTLPRGAAGAGVTPCGQWSAETTYALNDAVRHASAWWRSLHADNLNNPPPATRIDNTHWEVIVADGLSADPLVITYNSTDDPDDAGWHLPPWQAGDTHFRMSTDGGISHSQAFPLSQPAPATVVRYNPDAVTDWHDIPGPVGTADYCLTAGRYFRLRVVGGIWGPASEIHSLDAAEQLRVQYAVTPESGEPAWHGVLQPADNRIRFYNLAGTIRKDISVSLEPGQQIGRVQTCAISDPWHADYADTDAFMKLSTDGGTTFGSPIPVRGKSAYEEWLEAGNVGTKEDFLNSLKGTPGAPGSGIRFDATGTLADRDNYDSTPLGFVYLASDGDGDGGPALFQRSSAMQGTWSDPVPITPGPPGRDAYQDWLDQGHTGSRQDFLNSLKGEHGEAAPIFPDLEFTDGELLEDIDHGNYLLLDGTTPIAQVELYDAAGNGIVIERGDAAENGRCMIVTRWSAGETIIYFGELDISRGGRVRFAQSSAVYTGRTVTTEIIPIASAVADTDDDDGDADTAYKVIIPGYVVGVSTYADAGAVLADRYDTKLTYDPATAESTIWLSQGEYDTIAALPDGKDVLVVDYARDLTAPRYMITQVVNAAAPSADKYPSEAAMVAYADGLAIKAVTALPATPIAGQMIRLTAADDAAKAAPGVYVHDGVGWTCISYEAAYPLGNLGATPSLSLIPGAAYTATVDAEITSFTVAFSRPGLCSITLTNASTLAVAQPAMTGRTSKLLAEGAWDGAATALSKALIEDDGTYIIVSAGGLA